MALNFVFKLGLQIMGHPVFLVGDANEIGAVQGQLQREFLQERIARVLKRAENSDSVSMLQNRAEKFGEVLSQTCPHWLDDIGMNFVSTEPKFDRPTRCCPSWLAEHSLS